MINILNKKQCDSVKILEKVTKAIYVMQSTQNKNKYRFGGIGVKGKNSAIRRLGQCAKFDSAGKPHSWKFIIIAELKPKTKALKVRQIENQLRKELIGKGGGIFEKTRTLKKDEFYCNSENVVVKVFKNFISTVDI
jgi:hypothetical protein